MIKIAPNESFASARAANLKGGTSEYERRWRPTLKERKKKGNGRQFGSRGKRREKLIFFFFQEMSG